MKSTFITHHLCPFCAGQLRIVYSGMTDNLETSKKNFAVKECSNCGVACLNPQPTGDVGHYYPGDYFSPVKAQPKINPLYLWYRDNQYHFDYGLINRVAGRPFNQIKSYLDVGCGSGERVVFGRELGIPLVHGIDPYNKVSVTLPKGAKILIQDPLTYFPKKKYQLVTLFGVLEHVTEPVKILNHIQKNFLDPTGILLIQVPNYGSRERKLFGVHWYGLDIPRHLWHFGPASLSQVLTRFNYRILKVIPQNAPLHPVCLAPSISRELDIRRIWAYSTKRSVLATQMFMLLWIIFTLITIPVNIWENLWGTASILTVICTPKSKS